MLQENGTKLPISGNLDSFSLIYFEITLLLYLVFGLLFSLSITYFWACRFTGTNYCSGVFMAKDRV